MTGADAIAQETKALTPTLAPGLEDIVQLALGDIHACALDRSGAVWCGGDNGHGQLGDGTTTRHDRATRGGTSEGFAAGDAYRCSGAAGEWTTTLTRGR